MLTRLCGFGYKRAKSAKFSAHQPLQKPMKTKTPPPPQHILICLSIVLAFAALSSPLRAATTTWTAASDNNWFNDANWTNFVPTASTDAYINNGTKVFIESPGAAARTVTIGANPGDSGALFVDGTNGGSLTVSVGCGGNTEDPNYIGLGIYVGYGGSGELSISNGGTVTSGYGYIALLPKDETNEASNGAVTIEGAGSAWTFAGCPDARLFVGGNNTAANLGGIALLSVTSGGAINITNHTQALVSLSVGVSGTLTGNGTITLTGDSFVSRLAAIKGTLAASGTLPFVGNLALASSAMTLFNVTPQASDRIDVKNATGTVAGFVILDGRLSVTMTGTFTPAVTRYTLLEAAGGRVDDSIFQSVSIKYPVKQHFTPKISYDASHVYLDLDFTQ